MSEEGADGDEPKKAYSSKLMQMRFMQRPKAKAAAVVTEEVIPPSFLFSQAQVTGNMDTLTSLSMSE